MSEESQEVKIIGVDKEAIAVSQDKKEHWVVQFRLSLSPDQSWQKKFYEVQDKNTDTMKRKSRVIGDSIKVEVAGNDDLQKVLDVLKIEVGETNVQCEEDYQKKIKIRQALTELQQKQTDATLKFKEDSDGLVF